MTYRAGEVEVLLTVDDKDVARAEKNVKATGDRIEKRAIKPEVDATGALAGMDRVETAAKKLVSERAVMKLDADIAGAEKRLLQTQNRLEDLQIKAEGGLNVDADVRRAEANLRRIEGSLEGLRRARANVEVEVDPTQALRGLESVDREAKQLVSRDVALRVNANVASAEQAVADIRTEIEYLQSLSPTVNVEADVKQAEARLAGAEAALKDLQGARATMVVEVDNGGAKKSLSDVADFAEDTGSEGGRNAGVGLATGIIAGLASIPIVGAVAKIGETLATTLIDEFNSALQIEVRQDRLEALTGVTESDAARFARLAGQAYANNFGESIESNMNTTRLALQFDLIDEEDTNRDAQKVVEGLSGIADVLQDDVGHTAQAVTTLLGTGMARSAQHAFDLIAVGAREGVDRGEDLLDTLIEYPSVLERLGLSGEEMLGLLNQGLDAGARNSDVAADALKEFQIRATDASDASAAGFERLGLNAEEMTAKIAAGGAGAREGLQQVLDKLRETEDPVVRNAAAVELFGTKAEDLGEALFAMDLTSAVDQLNGVTGAADRMFSTIADNDASRVTQAQRNIEVAADGIKGALASAFSEPLGDFADFVSKNRGPVMQFLLDLANGALDFGESMVEGAAAGTEAFGEFVSGPLADVVDGIGSVIDIFNGFEGRPKDLDELRDSMRGFDDATKETASSMREELGGALDEARTRLSEFGEPAVAMGFLNDASLRLAESIDTVGYAADGSKLSLEGVDVANLSASDSGKVLEGQVRASIAALADEVAAAQAAGEGQEALTGRYETATGALRSQLEAMGLTKEEAQALIDTVLKTPKDAKTQYSSNANSEKSKVQGLADRITTLPDGSVVVTVNTTPARNGLEGFIQSATGRRIAVYVDTYGGRSYQNAGSNIRYEARGDVLEFMAGGGIVGGTPMQSLATIVSPNTYRVVGDRGDVPELFAPLDGSARSWALLMEGLRRMPGSPLGGPPAPETRGSVPPIQVIHNGNNYAYDPTDIARQQRQGLTRALDALPSS
jgi:hypothetical protein